MAKKIKADQFETTGTDAIRTSTGPTDLSVGAIADGEYLKRVGATVVGATPSASDPDAIHDNVAGEIVAVTEKVTPADADVLLIEDSADSNNKKRLQVGNLPGGTDTDAIHKSAAAEISTITEKASPVSADLVVIEDSEDSNNKKRVQVGNLPGGSGGGAVSQYIGTGRWEFVDEISVGSDVTSVSFGVGGDGTYGAALDGDVDETYLVEFYFPDPGTDVDYSLRPNAVSTDQVAARHYGGSIHGVATSSDMKFADGGSGRVIYGSFTLQAKSGIPRMLVGKTALASSPESTSSIWEDDYAAIWDNSASNITTLDLVSSVASKLMTGAWFRLYRRSSNRGNAISPGAMEYLDSIFVTGDVTSVTFGAGGDGINQYPLDGDVDDEYIVEWYIPMPGAANIRCTYQPNGISTNQVSGRQYGGTSGGSQTSTDLQFYEEGSSERSGFGYSHIFARSGKPRYFITNGCIAVIPESTTGIFSDHTVAVWDDTTTNITYLDLVATAASAIKTGAYFHLYRVTKRNIRADSADSYERHVTAACPEGSGTEEYTTGHATYGGSAVGLSAKLEEAVDGGTVTVNLKVGGSAVLTAVLNTTDTTFARAVEKIGVHRFEPGDSITVEVVRASYSNAANVTSGLTVNVTLQNNSLFVLPENGVVAETVLSAAADTIAVVGLDGDVHGEYRIDFHILLATAQHTIDLNPNGGTPSSIYSRYFENYGTATLISDDIQLVDMPGTVTSGELVGRILASVARQQGGVSKTRTFDIEAATTYPASPYNSAYNIKGSWRDATDNLTSIEIVTNVASGFLAGSRVTVRKV